MFKVTWFENQKPQFQRCGDAERARNLAKSLVNRPGVTGVVSRRDDVSLMDMPVRANRPIGTTPYNRRYDLDRDDVYESRRDD